MTKKGLTIGKTRSVLYKVSRILGDFNALKRGTVGKRVSNRVVGKVSGRVSSKISKSIMKLFS